MTAMAVRRLNELGIDSRIVQNWTEAQENVLVMIEDIQRRMQDELSLILFFKLPADKKKYFDDPRDGWAEVIDRFPDATSDIVEMAKCFALSRFSGAAFHSLLIVEIGVIELGSYIEVTDPKRGWDSTTKKLKALVDGGHNGLPAKLSGQYAFLEQVNQCVQAMKHAWRNKVNHADGKLVVLRSDFAPDTTEEIMMASRAFMRRLATEMPK